MNRWRPAVSVTVLILSGVCAQATAEATPLRAGGFCELVGSVRVSAKPRGRGKKTALEAGATLQLIEVAKAWTQVSTGDVTGFTKTRLLNKKCVPVEPPAPSEEVAQPAGRATDQNEEIGVDAPASAPAEPEARPSESPSANEPKTLSVTPKMAVLPLTGNRVEAELVTILDELLLNAIARHARYEVIGASDINSMLGLEKMKDAMGCDDVACAAEIGGALGVSYLAAGTVSRLGGEMYISLKLINIDGHRVESRVQESVPDDESLFKRAMEATAARLVGAPAPPEMPARASPQMSAGAAAEAEPEPTDDTQRQDEPAPQPPEIHGAR